MLRRLVHTRFTYPQSPMARIKTFAFLDLETTGLPMYENNTTKITELTVLTVQTKHLLMGVIPRVQNKLSLCFNPRKLICNESEKLTGLSNEALEHMAPFSPSTVHMLINFLEHNPKPICLVAHNGNQFDYPILRTEIEKTGCQLPEDILCLDSLQAFRALHAQQQVDKIIPLEFQDGFDDILCKALDEYESSTSESGYDPVRRALEVQKVNETTPGRKIKYDLEGNNQDGPGKSKKARIPESKRKLNFGVSFKLGDVYERLTNQKAGNAHQAENDVVMLAVCAATLGEDFANWAEGNTKKFSEIPPMVSWKKIGT